MDKAELERRWFRTTRLLFTAWGIMCVLLAWRYAGKAGAAIDPFGDPATSFFINYGWMLVGVFSLMASTALSISPILWVRGKHTEPRITNLSIGILLAVGILVALYGLYGLATHGSTGLSGLSVADMAMTGIAQVPLPLLFYREFRALLHGGGDGGGEAEKEEVVGEGRRRGGAA